MKTTGTIVNSCRDTSFRVVVLSTLLMLSACDHLSQKASTMAAAEVEVPAPAAQKIEAEVLPQKPVIPAASSPLPVVEASVVEANVVEANVVEANSAPAPVVAVKPVPMPDATIQTQKQTQIQVPIKTATPVEVPAKVVEVSAKVAALAEKPVANVVIVPAKKPDTAVVQPASDISAATKTAPVMEDSKKPLAGTVQGSVVILGKNSEKLVPQDVIVNLEPLFDVPANKLPPHTYNIDMKGKRYMPGAMAIKAGDKVNFHNLDSIKHNVFSSSAGNTFDLGTYGLDVTKGVSLKKPGIVKVYCNIHAEMATFIAINTKGYSYITRADGKFIFRDVPAGEYLLSIWHVRGETRKRFTVSSGKVVQNAITLDTAKFELEPHLNKFGKSYQVNPTLFKDEFY